MSKNNDGGPAFPVADYDHRTFSPETVSETRRLLSGMSLRAYIAANIRIEFEVDIEPDQAESILGRSVPTFEADPVGNLEFWAALRARLCVIEADALIAELERDQ